MPTFITPPDKTVLKIGSDDLPEAELTRFTVLFQVAQTRGAVAWTQVPPAEAEVVVSHGVPWRATQAVNLCIDPRVSCAAELNVIPLESGFRVATLIEALDRASARVLQRRGQSLAGAAVGYRLRHWVVLGPDQQSANHARVMAAMSRRNVTREWMATGAGLGAAQIEGLLSELRAHGALCESRPDGGARREPDDNGGPRVLLNRPGFVGRLRHWFAGASATDNSLGAQR